MSVHPRWPGQAIGESDDGGTRPPLGGARVDSNNNNTQGYLPPRVGREGRGTPPVPYEGVVTIGKRHDEHLRKNREASARRSVVQQATHDIQYHWRPTSTTPPVPHHHETRHKSSRHHRHRSRHDVDGDTRRRDRSGDKNNRHHHSRRHHRTEEVNSPNGTRRRHSGPAGPVDGEHRHSSHRRRRSKRPPPPPDPSTGEVLVRIRVPPFPEDLMGVPELSPDACTYTETPSHVEASPWPEWGTPAPSTIRRRSAHHGDRGSRTIYYRTVARGSGEYLPPSEEVRQQRNRDPVTGRFMGEGSLHSEFSSEWAPSPYRSYPPRTVGRSVPNGHHHSPTPEVSDDSSHHLHEGESLHHHRAMETPSPSPPESLPYMLDTRHHNHHHRGPSGPNHLHPRPRSHGSSIDDEQSAPESGGDRENGRYSDHNGAEDHHPEEPSASSRALELMDADARAGEGEEPQHRPHHEARTMHRGTPEPRPETPPQPDPIVQSVTIHGIAEENTDVTMQAEFIPPSLASSSVYNWYHLSPGEPQHSAKQIVKRRSHTLRLSDTDVGYIICGEVVPVDSDGVRGDPRLAFMDTPVVAATPPVQVAITGEPTEGSTLRAVISNVVGDPLEGRAHWTRKDMVVGTNTLEYNLGVRDVGLPITFEYTPPGAVTALSAVSPVVTSRPPQVFNLRIVGSTRVGSDLTLEYDFVGVEGRSRVRWTKITNQGFEALQDFSDRTYISLTFHEVDCYIRAVFTPVDAFGAEGEPVTYTTPDTVGFAPPKVISYVLDGEALEGSTLTARVKVEYDGNDNNSDDVIRWFRDGQPVPKEKSNTYTLGIEDVGSVISYQYTPYGDGQAGEPVTAKSALIQPTEPTVSGLQLSPIVCGRPIQCLYNYSGGTQDNTGFTWHRSTDGERWDLIEETITSVYLSTADDLNHFVKCTVTPRNSSGREGQQHEVHGYVVLSNKYKTELQKFLQEGVKGFNVKNQEEEKMQILMNHRSVRVIAASESRKVVHRSPWSPETGVMLEARSETGFTLQLAKDRRYPFTIARRDARDLLVLVFRTFHGMSMPEVATPVVGDVVATQWKKGKTHDIKFLPQHKDPAPARVTPDGKAIPLTYEERQQYEHAMQQLGMPVYLAREALQCIVSTDD